MTSETGPRRVKSLSHRLYEYVSRDDWWFGLPSGSIEMSCSSGTGRAPRLRGSRRVGAVCMKRISCGEYIEDFRVIFYELYVSCLLLYDKIKMTITKIYYDSRMLLNAHFYSTLIFKILFVALC